MLDKNTIWLKAIQWMQNAGLYITERWPEELPPETTIGFWKLACQIEMRDRETISQKIRLLISNDGAQTPMTDLEAWLYRRRVEWAGQVALSQVQKGVEPVETLNQVLEWLLIRTWETDGCIAFWNHAIERGGKPHPENPDGMSPIRL